MSNVPTNSDDSRREDYLVALLIDYFRAPSCADNFSHAAKIALNLITRDSIFKADLLKKRYYFFASQLKGNITPTSLRNFAQACYSAAEKTGAWLPKKETRPTVSLRTITNTAKEEVKNSLKRGHSEGAAINRAAYELVKIRQENFVKSRQDQRIKSHPLSEMLSGLGADGRIAREDVRNHFLRLKKSHRKGQDGVLYQLLMKAKSFSAPVLHRLMGDELFFICRPTGFLDQRGYIVVVEVPTSAHLHAMTYRKLDLLRALKKDDNFGFAKAIHLKLQAYT